MVKMNLYSQDFKVMGASTIFAIKISKVTKASVTFEISTVKIAKVSANFGISTVIGSSSPFKNPINHHKGRVRTEKRDF